MRLLILFELLYFCNSLKLNKSVLSNTINNFNLRKGSHVALVTPMLDNGKIDYKSFDNLLKWQISQGTQGIVILGSTGESCTINANERTKPNLTFKTKKDPTGALRPVVESSLI